MSQSSQYRGRRRRRNTSGLYLLLFLIISASAFVLWMTYGRDNGGADVPSVPPTEEASPESVTGTPSAEPSAEPSEQPSEEPSPTPDMSLPSAEPVDQMGEAGQEIEAAAFCISLTPGASAAFAQTPDWNLQGRQTVFLTLTGSNGQTAGLEAQLVLWKGSQPPYFEGVEDISIEIGETVAYKTGVKVKDDKDSSLKYTIDNSGVNLDAVGEYPVIYSATDKDGNRTDVTVTLTVRPLDVDKLNELVDSVLATFITPDMTPMEQVKAVYDFTRLNISYINHGDKSDRNKVAYYGLKTRKGDCYTFCVVAEAMFDRLGIEYVQVERVGGTTQHFWSLVNLGEGYYHFDSTPHKKKYNACMITESRAQEITADRGNNYYVYDKTKAPEVVP